MRGMRTCPRNTGGDGMGYKQTKVLVDTNLWIDKYIPHGPTSEASREVLRLCVSDDIALLYPMRSLVDVFWQVTRDRKNWLRREYGEITEAQARAVNADAWACVDNMMEVGAPVGADVSDVWIAQHLRDMHPDFEDDMVLAAARRAGVDYLVTSDRQLIQKADVVALTPEDMLTVLRNQRALQGDC